MKKYVKRKNSQEVYLKGFLSKLFQKQFKNIELPKTYSLFNINKQFLVAFPKNIYFEFINIISYEKSISEELSSCFISNAFNEINELKEKLYNTLYVNSTRVLIISLY